MHDHISDSQSSLNETKAQEQRKDKIGDHLRLSHSRCPVYLEVAWQKKCATPLPRFSVFLHSWRRASWVFCQLESSYRGHMI
jgi:hypothetical protein